MEGNMYTRKTILTFGKHKGLSIQTLLLNDPSYIVWMSENIKDIQFEGGIVDEAEENDWSDYGDSDRQYGLDYSGGR
jgi:hypothetical protein